MKRFRRKLLVAVIAVLATAVTAWAFYSTAGAGDGDVTVGSFTPATISVPAASTGTHAVSWTAQASLSDTSKNSQIKYVVQRSLDGGSFANVPNGSCSGELSHGTTSCSDTVTTAGSYTYRVVSKYKGWTATSNEAGAVVVTLAVGPAPPTSVALANGGGVGNAYINDANKGSLNVTVGLGGTSLATDTVHVTITDGPHTTADKTAPATTGSGSVTVTGIDASALNDGSVTIRATSSNAAGTSSPTTTDVTKDTVKPSSAVGTVNNITSGSTFTVPYTASDSPNPISSLDKVELYVDPPGAAGFSLARTDTTPTAGEDFSYDQATANGLYGFYTRAYDDAGNAEDDLGAAEKTARRSTPPTVTAGVIAKTEGLPNSTAGFIRAFSGGGNLGTYRVYANVTPGSDSISTVTANLSGVFSGGSTALSLTACTANCTVNDVTYGWVSNQQTAVATSAGTKGFSVTATDSATPALTHTLGDAAAGASSALTVVVDNTRPNIASVSTSGDGDGVPETGETITYGYDSAIDGVSLFSSWVWPFATTNVRVAFTDRNTNPDRVTITGGASFTTALSLGNLDLGATTYVTGGNGNAAFFGGTGAAQPSTIARSGNTIVVTLGTSTAGTGGTIGAGAASSIATWSGGNSGVYDAAGNAVTNSPSSVSTGNVAQF